MCYIIILIDMDYGYRDRDTTFVFTREVNLLFDWPKLDADWLKAVRLVSTGL